MSSTFGRRSFLKKSLAATVAAPVVISMEEHLLVSQAAAAETSAVLPVTPKPPSYGKWYGTIGKVKMGRILCGGNLISGYAHSRDLIYVSKLLKHYFTDEKIIETWARCEENGVNTMVTNPSDPNALRVYQKYRKMGGKIQYLAQIGPNKDDLKTAVQQAVDGGAVGAFLLGNLGDLWTRTGSTSSIAELIDLIKAQGLIAGVAGHELRTPREVEKSGAKPDFYVKTLHHTNYWSTRRSDQTKDVSDNYSIDNYWCQDPKETINFMSKVDRPWIAYKVLAAGAIPPKSGFRHAFENGADFAMVGMFDFQVAENVSVANEVLNSQLDRERGWMA